MFAGPTYLPLSARVSKNTLSRMVHGALADLQAALIGRVSLQIIRVYIKAMGGYWAFLLLMSWFILVETARVGTTIWLSQWTSSVDAPGGAAHKSLWYLGIYAGISGAQVQPASNYLSPRLGCQISLPQSA